MAAWIRRQYALIFAVSSALSDDRTKYLFRLLFSFYRASRVVRKLALSPEHTWFQSPVRHWQTKIFLAVAPSGVRIFEAPAVEVKEGQTQKLRCSSASSGNPTPRLQWQRVARSGETSILAANETRRIQDQDNSAFNAESVLIIVANRSGNGDSYQCSLFYQDRLIASQRVSFEVICECDFC